MSNTVKLELFKLRIRKKGEKKNYINLLDVAGFNLIEEISRYLSKNIYLFKIDNENERTSRIEKNELNENSIFCRIKVGKFGQSSEIVDTQSGSGIFHKEREHSDTIPLFFAIILDKTNESATVLVERSGNLTLQPNIKSILNFVLDDLREDTFVSEFKPLKSSVSLNKCINKNMGEIDSLTIFLDDNKDIDYLEPTAITIKSKLRKCFPKDINDLIINSAVENNFSQLNSLLPESLKNAKIDKVLIDLKIYNKGKFKIPLSKTINFNNSVSLPLDKENLDKFGHPTFKSMIDIAKKSL